MGSLRRRVELQNTGDFDDIFLFIAEIADAQAFDIDNACGLDNPEKTSSRCLSRQRRLYTNLIPFMEIH